MSENQPDPDVETAAAQRLAEILEPAAIDAISGAELPGTPPADPADPGDGGRGRSVTMSRLMCQVRNTSPTGPGDQAAAPRSC